MPPQQTEQLQENSNPIKGPDEGSDGGILRRNNRGCKSKEFYNWPEQSFDDMDSPLAVQQYIQQLIRRDPADVDEIVKLPEGQDLGAWKIEHLRLFCMQLNWLATRLQDCCQPETCNQMTATEQWIFLCAAHKQPNECSAIDYTRHTLDGAASLLNSNKYFPSRVTIKESSVAKLGSVCRRVYRIFTHAYYHHFQVFDEFESETHLCKRFSKFVTTYELMSKDGLIVPSDGSKPDQASTTQSVLATSATTNTSGSLTSSTVTSKQLTDLADDVPNEADSTMIIKSEAAKLPTQTKLDSDKASVTIGANKRAPNNEPGSAKNQSPQSAATWVASQISTNTMVKGSTSLSKGAKAEDDGDSAVGGDNLITSSPSTTTSTSAPKNSIESEA